MSEQVQHSSSEDSESAREARIEEMGRWAEATGKLAEAHTKLPEGVSLTEGSESIAHYGIDPDTGKPFTFFYGWSPETGRKPNGIKSGKDGSVIQYAVGLDSGYVTGKLRSPSHIRSEKRSE